jgi:hypothetical protein
MICFIIPVYCRKCKVDFIGGNATGGNIKVILEAQASGGNEMDVRRRSVSSGLEI